MTQPAIPESSAARVALAQLVPSSLNPRRTFNAEADGELLASIEAHGILTPLLVRPTKPAAGDEDVVESEGPAAFEIVAGHRRYHAARALGLEDVPVTVRELDDDQAREAAIIENLQREDLAPLDEALAYQALLTRPGQTPAMVAAAVGKSPAYVGRRLKLLTLVPEAQTALREGALGVAHAELLAKLTPELQTKALDEVVWLPMVARYGRDDWIRCANYLEPIAELREWVDRRTKLDVNDADALSLFSEANDLIEDVKHSSGVPLPLEIALDRFGSSPPKHTIPFGVLRVNKDFREVPGKRCKSAERAIVVFGDRKGDVVMVCCDKKGCATHWPPKAKPDPSAKADKRPSLEEQEHERKRQQAIWERVRPAIEQVIIAASAKVKTTPKLLREILEYQAADQAARVIKAVGKLTPDTFGRAWVLADALSDLYTVDGAERALKAVNGFFDVTKAMKATEAAMAAEAAVAKAEAQTRTPAKKSTTKGRAAVAKAEAQTRTPGKKSTTKGRAA